MSYRIKIKLSYDGSRFGGWQRQAPGIPTVQEALEDGVKKLFGVSVPVIGASRTDAGVHAFGQVAHFNIPRDPSPMRDFVYSLQAQVPHDIAIKGAWLAPQEFHAIKSASSKVYRYWVFNSRRPSALKRHHSLWIRHRLALDELNEASSFLVGKQDFKAFQNTGGSAKTTIREVFSAKWVPHGPNSVVFEIHGNGFLKQMVRNIVGTLIEMQIQGHNPSKIGEILESRDRRVALATAPPQGLYLQKIFYPDLLDKRCRKL